MKKTSILITGASGFIGANLVRNLLKRGYDVHVILRSTKNVWRLRDILPQLTVHKGTIEDKSFLIKLFKKFHPNHIFHLAAYGAYSTQTDFEQMVLTNINGLANLLLTSKDIPYKSFVVTGSSSEYGYKKKPMKETDFLLPDSYYAATKASATHLAQIFAKKNNKPIVVFRLFSVYGPYEEPSRLIPTAIHAALANTTLPLTTGKVQRDFIFLDDVVDAYCYVMKRKMPIGEVFNIGTGIQYSNDDIAKTIKKINKGHLDIKKGAFPQRNWDTQFWIADIHRSKNVLSWRAKTSLSQGLEKTYQWFLKNNKKYEKIYGKI